MKNVVYFILCFASMSAQALTGKEAQNNDPEITVNADRLLPAKYSDAGKGKSSLGLSQGTVQAMMTHTFNAKDYGALVVGYNRTKFDWGKDLSLRTHTFQNPFLKIGGATFRSHRWGWDANLTYEMLDERCSLARYALWQGLIHGAFAYTNRCDFHIGAFASKGSHFTKVLPVIGVSFRPCNDVAVNLIFPTKASILWMLGDHWSVDLAGHLFYIHERFGDREHKKYKEGFLTYRNIGFELGGNYEIKGLGAINIHAGYALGGYFTLSNRFNHSQRHYHTRPAPYLGLAANLRF
jgi:hypothetical protein